MAHLPEAPKGSIHLVLLHSNDIHGDFFPKDREGTRTGGLSLLSGYIRRVRRECPNVLYAIGGDMFMGSLIDQEYRGLSSIRLTNVLEPDVFALGNHEVDYGLSHLLFLEKCADFPVICANMYIRELNRRLFLPCVDIRRDGILVRFIGLLTPSVNERISQEALIDRTVSVRDVRRELVTFFEKEQREPADLTVLLTHIGIEEDRPLASFLKKEWGVDLILGGHSHTFMDAPVIEAGIPIVQAGSGSGQIGRFDLYFDPDTRRLERYSWQLQCVTAETSEPDPLVDFYGEYYENAVNRKYDQVLFTLPQQYTHPTYHNETQIMDLITDIYQDAFSCDLFMMTTNVLRTRQLGPTVTRKDFKIALPYDNAIYFLRMDGRRLEKMIRYMYRRESWFGTAIFFLCSGQLHFTLTHARWEIESLTLGGMPIDPDRVYTVGTTGYAYKNLSAFLGIRDDELEKAVQIRKVCDNDHDYLEDYFSAHRELALKNEGRIHFLDKRI